MTDSNVVPFGKYKGQTVADIAARDPGYLQWLMQQNWFVEKFQSLVVNVTNVGPASEETPAHNALQVRFLDESYRTAFAAELFDDFSVPAFCKTMKQRAREESRMLRWARCPHHYSTYSRPAWLRDGERREAVLKAFRKRRIYQVAVRTATTSGLQISYAVGAPQFEAVSDVVFIANRLIWALPVSMTPDDEDAIHDTRRLMVEIKPSLGDDFPAVLRQIKKQQERLDTLAAIYRSPLGDGDVGSRNCTWVLAVGEYAGRGATIDQVSAVFEAAGIAIVMMGES